MADSEEQNKEQEQNLEIRKAVASAYAFVDGQKAVQSFAALTFEDLLDQQIERIEGKGTDLRPNQLDRVTKVESDLKAAVDKIKAMPPEAFAKPDPKNDVNTPVFDDQGNQV